ncbi:MAG: hypothetical protein ING80_16245 [Rhodocyclaceae bacterium]|nr:hypothetical protein [Rhodocyclaceae bacterium]MCA3134999.1 hypothetical protein [Rhodocyclaceae bacterium]MCA3143738.1 hypothetical protein [Rhodocyclaceae bacterium]MCA3147109.1 hypothetical protein [Rhodocyclaceae bacterium]
MHGATHPARSDAQSDLFGHIEACYNRSRRHSTRGYSSPAQSPQRCISKHAAQSSMAA